MPTRTKRSEIELVKAGISARKQWKAGRLSLTSHRVDVPRTDIKAVRVKLKLSQTEFAERFGLSVKSVRNWEQESREPERPIGLLLYLISQAPDYVAREVKRLSKKGAELSKRKGPPSRNSK